MVASTQQLMEVYGPEPQLEVTLPNEEHQRDFDISIQMLKDGNRLGKTSDEGESAAAYKHASHTSESACSRADVYL